MTRKVDYLTSLGERVFLFKPAEKTGESIRRPFHGPYWVVELSTNTACIRRVVRPQEEPFLVALQCLRYYPEEIAEEFWLPDKSRISQSSKSSKSSTRCCAKESVPSEMSTSVQMDTPQKEQVLQTVGYVHGESDKNPELECTEMSKPGDAATQSQTTPTLLDVQKKTGSRSSSPD